MQYFAYIAEVLVFVNRIAKAINKKGVTKDDRKQ